MPEKVVLLSRRKGSVARTSRETRWLLVILFVVAVMLSYPWLLFSVIGAWEERDARVTTKQEVIRITGAEAEVNSIQEEKMPARLDTVFDGVVARAFEPHRYKFPCFHPTDGLTSGRWPGNPPVYRGPTKDGFLFVKVQKTGSSSGAGVHLRIARNVAQRSPDHDFDICKARCMHARAKPINGLDLKHRHFNSSFVWTMVREPTKRAISQFFHFLVSRENVIPTDENFIRYLPKDHYAIEYLSTEGYHLGSDDPTEHANQILQHYNFIGATERIDESLVVLSMLLDLPLADILYVSAKRNGGYDDGAFRNTCYKIQPSFVSPGMKEYFASDTWTNLIRPEVALFQAVNRSLDLTIDLLGRQAVQTRVVEYRQALALVNERCTPDTVNLPCTKDGIRRFDKDIDCYAEDLACGMSCLDQVATELDLW
jgi:hypothetical protein